MATVVIWKTDNRYPPAAKGRRNSYKEVNSEIMGSGNAVAVEEWREYLALATASAAERNCELSTHEESWQRFER